MSLHWRYMYLYGWIHYFNKRHLYIHSALNSQTLTHKPIHWHRRRQGSSANEKKTINLFERCAVYTVHTLSKKNEKAKRLKTMFFNGQIHVNDIFINERRKIESIKSSPFNFFHEPMRHLKIHGTKSKENLEISLISVIHFIRILITLN